MQNDKRKFSPRLPMMNAWGCLFGLVMLAFGLISGAAVGLFGLPYLLNYDVTQTVAWVKIHLMETRQADTEAMLNVTAQAAFNQGTQAALNFEATQFALGNANTLLNQTATQSALFGAATATARTDQYNNALTQIALDQQGTQAGMQLNATQSQQRLSEEATKVQLNFQATQAAIQGQPLTATPQPRMQAQTAPQQELLIGPQLPATEEAPVVFEAQAQFQAVEAVEPTSLMIDSVFASGIDTAIWTPSKDTDWVNEPGGVRSAVDGAVIASRGDFTSPIEIEVAFTPALSPDSDYRILFGREGDQGYEVILNAAALTARQITLAGANGELIVSNGAQGALTGDTRLIVTVVADQVTVRLNGQTILTSTLPTPPNGNIAVSFPKGAFLKAVQVR